MYRYISIFFIVLFVLQQGASALAADNVLTMGEAVKSAVENNYRLRAAMEAHKSAMESTKSARADMFAKATAKYSYTELKDQPFSINSGREIPVAHKSQYHWDVSLVQPLFTGFALTTLHEMAKTDEKIKEFEKEKVLLDIVQRVKTAYYNVLLGEKMLLVAEGDVKALKSHEEDAEKYYKQGLIPHNDLLKSRVALADAVQQREKSRASLVLAISDLNLVMGSDIHTKRTLEEVKSDGKSAPGLHELIREALESRSLLKGLRMGLEKQRRGVTLAKSGYYPEISLVGTYEADGDDLSASNNDYGNRDNASLSLQGTWTFFEWGKTRAKVAGQRHDLQAIEEGLKEAGNGVRLQVQNAFLNLGVAGKNIQTAEKALKQAKENWRITKLQYDQQVVNSTEVLDARAYLTKADSNYYNALYGYLISFAELERAVGREGRGH